jgi:hypothetical protein
VLHALFAGLAKTSYARRETAGSPPARRLTALPASRELANPEHDRVALFTRHSAHDDALTAHAFWRFPGVRGLDSCADQWSVNVDGLQVLAVIHPPTAAVHSPCAELPECPHSWHPGRCISPPDSPGMARDRAVRDSRHYYEEHSPDERERRHRRRHRSREYDDEYAAAKRERRERRRADEARREAELDIHDLRARRESYYSRPEPERHRESERMAQDIQVDREKDKSRSSHREVRRDGTVRRKKRRETLDDARSEDYVYGRPKSRGVVEEVTVRRSSHRHRSDEGGSSSRTAYTPLSGSRSASLRKDDSSKLGRSMSAREPQKVYMRPTVRRTSTIKLPTATAAPVSRPPLSPRDSARRSTGGLFANLFKAPPRSPDKLLHKEIPRLVSTSFRYICY